MVKLSFLINTAHSVAERDLLKEIAEESSLDGSRATLLFIYIIDRFVKRLQVVLDEDELYDLIEDQTWLGYMFFAKWAAENPKEAKIAEDVIEKAIEELMNIFSSVERNKKKG